MHLTTKNAATADTWQLHSCQSQLRQYLYRGIKNGHVEIEHSTARTLIAIGVANMMWNLNKGGYNPKGLGSNPAPDATWLRDRGWTTQFEGARPSIALASDGLDDGCIATHGG